MNSSSPNRTTLLGGLGLAIVALIRLAPLVNSWLPNPVPALALLREVPGQLAGPAVLLVACVILAFGYPRERDVVGGSVLGRIGFLALGLAVPIQILWSLAGIALSVRIPYPWIGGIWVGTALNLLPTIALVIAAIAVVRARVVSAVARWMLAAAAGAAVIESTLSLVPNGSQPYDTALFLYGVAVPQVLLLGAGVTLALEGRTAAIGQRVHALYDSWYRTT